MPRPLPLLLFALAASAVGADPAAAQDTPPCDSDAERYVVRQVAAGDPADLSAAGDSARTLDAACLQSLLSNTRSPGDEVTLIGAIVRGPVNAGHQKISRPLTLVRVVFRDPVALQLAHFQADVSLDGSTFAGGLDVMRADFEGNLSLQGTVFQGPVNGFGLSVGGAIEATGAEFHQRLDLRGATVTGDARFTGIAVHADADVSRARFGGDVIFDRGRFLGGAATVSFERTRVDQSLFMTALDTIAPTLWFLYTDVGVHVRADSNRWVGPVVMGGLKVGKHVELDHGVFHQPLSLDAASVGGDLRIAGARFEPGADASFALATVGSTATFRGSEFGGRALLEGLRVGGRMDLENSAFRRYLSLRDLSAQSMVVHGMRSPAQRDSFQIDGLVHGRLLGQGGHPPVPDSLIAFVNRARFSAGAYASLEKFFADQGDRRSANRALFSRKKWERGELKPATEVGSWLMMVTVAYGRWPALAFVWCAVFIAIGMRVFSRARIEEVNPGSSSLRTFDPFWYSFDTFLPAVNLRCADDWRLVKEDSPGAWLYLRVHTLAGWVLIPIGLAAISGLLK